MNFKKSMSAALLVAAMTVAGSAFAAENWQNVNNEAAKISLIVPAEWTVSYDPGTIFTAKGENMSMTMTKSEKKISTQSLNRISTASREMLLQDVRKDYLKKNPRAKLMSCGFVEHPLRSEIRIIASVLDENKDRHYQMTSMFRVDYHWYKVESNYPISTSAAPVEEVKRCIKSLSFE